MMDSPNSARPAQGGAGNASPFVDCGRQSSNVVSEEAETAR
jgi:hypothetical protein